MFKYRRGFWKNWRPTKREKIVAIQHDLRKRVMHSWRIRLNEAYTEAESSFRQYKTWMAETAENFGITVFLWKCHFMSFLCLHLPTNCRAQTCSSMNTLQKTFIETIERHTHVSLAVSYKTFAQDWTLSNSNCSAIFKTSVSAPLLLPLISCPNHYWRWLPMSRMMFLYLHKPVPKWLIYY